MERVPNDCKVSCRALVALEEKVDSIIEFNNRVDEDMYNHGRDGLKTQFLTYMAEARKERELRKSMEEESKQKRKNRLAIWSISVVLIAALLVYPVDKAWRVAGALVDLAEQAPTIIKLTADWKAFYENPPVHQMDPPPVVTPPEAQPFHVRPTKPRKPKTSFFEYEPRGVGLLHEPLLQSDNKPSFQ